MLPIQVMSRKICHCTLHCYLRRGTFWKLNLPAAVFGNFDADVCRTNPTHRKLARGTVAIAITVTRDSRNRLLLAASTQYTLAACL